MVLKSVWKLPELQAQTSQFEMALHEDEHNFREFVLIKNLPMNANLSNTV